MAGKSQPKLVNPPGAIESAVTCSPTTWSYCDLIRWHLPKVVIAIGALFLVVGIIITILSNTDSVDYSGGFVAGPVLVVLGTVMVIGGILWLMFRAAYSNSYSTTRNNNNMISKGHENLSYANNEGAARAGSSKLGAEGRGGGGKGVVGGAAPVAVDNVQIVIGYVPTQEEDWQIGDIYKPQVIQ